MAKYELLPTTPILSNGTMLQSHHLPELVHLDDPALSVMTDFSLTPVHTILPTDNMDKAISDMENIGTHLLLVIDEHHHFQGIITTEDLWGEKPIKLLQERRIPRDQVLVRSIMVPYTQVTALDMSTVKLSKVGHIVKTLASHHVHYALCVSQSAEDANTQIIRGIFTATQISKQLHRDMSDLF